ncbi:MAG: NYN domain-containing protein [Candidatus Kerfeldbacteria bacterium]|nr:NYN domain-containing protein [Candidatus Kerfeldbacteria bacterium]
MKTFAYVDASNLFYGGEKSLGWKIDYLKLLNYLRKRYDAMRVYYFGGVETYNFHNDVLHTETVPLKELERHLDRHIKTNQADLNEAELALIGRHVRRVRFYRRLEKFGYQLFLKPVKKYEQEDGTTKRKANIDVDMTFQMMRDIDLFDRVIVLSGDGDFLPVLKHLRSEGKEVLVLARGPRTAKEIKQFAGSDFRDFVTLERALKYEEK